MKSSTIRLKVNGRTSSIEVYPNETLNEVLRDKFRLTEVKVGCLGGECGSCTILLNGKAVDSCLMLAVQANGADLVTIRGLVSNGQLHPLQKAFIAEGAVECGFCTGGFILSALSYLKENPRPSPEEIRAAVGGNLCRCTGYENMIKAILEASKQRYGKL